MNKENDNIKLVPKLRFPEFRELEEWAMKPFDELFTIGSGRDYKHLEEGDYPVYGTGGYMLSVDDYLYDGKSACIGRKGTIDKPILLSGKFWTVDTLFYTHSFKDCTPDFIYLLFQNINWKNYNEAGGVPSLSKNIIYAINQLVPKQKEQQKIVECIYSLDNLIAAENEKLEALQAHKKGLLQQLFPAIGETVPKLRFGEFSGEWEETTLGEIGSPLMCKRIFKEQTSTDSTNSVPFYKIGTFGKVADAYIPIELFKEFKSKFSYPNVGDILISASGTIGRLVVYDGADGYYQDSNIVWLGHDESNLLNSFLYYYYSTVKWQTSDGGVIRRLYNSNLKEMVVVYPKDKREQQKIAEFISSHDELITTQMERLESLKEHKKGLMQQMFPNLNE